MKLKKKKKKGNAMEKAIDSMISDVEKSEYDELKPMLTIKISSKEEEI